MGAAPIRVAVFTPHPIVARGIASILSESAGQFAPAITDIDGPDADVALYDVAFLADGDTSTLEILVETTATPIMLIGTTMRPDLTARALDHGADGYVDLNAQTTELLQALDSITTCRADDPGSNSATGPIQEARARLIANGVDLSEREHQILALIAQGYSNREIAEESFLSVNTIKTYIRSAYSKIGATNRAGAVAWAIDHGLRST